MKTFPGKIVFINPKDMDEAKAREIALGNTIRDMDLQLGFYSSGEFAPSDPKWRNRILFAKARTVTELHLIRGWIKQNQPAALSQKELAKRLQMSCIILVSLRDKGVAMTADELAFVADLEKRYSPTAAEVTVIKAAKSPKPHRPLVKATADNEPLSVVRQIRDASSVEDAVLVGLELFLTLRDPADLEALRVNMERARSGNNRVAHCHAAVALAKAYTNLGKVEEAIRLLQEAPAEERETMLGWLNLAETTGNPEHLERVRRMTASLPPEGSLGVWAQIYQVFGHQEDLQRAHDTVRIPSLAAKRQSRRWLNLIRAHLHRNELTEAKNIMLQVADPNVRCAALAWIAEKSKQEKDLAALLQHIAKNVPRIGDIVTVRDVFRACFACGQADTAEIIAEDCKSSLQLAAFSLVASNTHGAMQQKAIARVEKILANPQVFDTLTPYAYVDAVRALLANGKHGLARELSCKIGVPASQAEACLLIHKSEHPEA